MTRMRQFNATFMVSAVICGAACERVFSQEVGDLALQIGITPEGLAAAGLSSTDAESALTLLAAEQGAIDALGGTVVDAEQSALEITDLEMALWRDPDNANLKQHYDDRVADLAAANQSIQKVRATLFEAGTGELSAEAATTLITVQTYCGSGISPEYCTTFRTAEEWRALCDALAAEQRALRTDVAIDERSADLLLDVRSEPQTASAIINLTQDLDEIQQVFEESGE